MIVENGKKVTLHYKGTYGGEVFDESTGREPLNFVVDSGMVIPGFNESVKGMSIGDKKTFTIPYMEAYGEHRPDLIMEVPIENVPENVEPNMVLETMVGNTPIPVLVTEVNEKSITIDGNHPLAGKDLTFEIEIIGVE
jgi:peptidylprolyl isomerase